jgi:hypothetical protein
VAWMVCFVHALTAEGVSMCSQYRQLLFLSPRFPEKGSGLFLTGAGNSAR